MSLNPSVGEIILRSEWVSYLAEGGYPPQASRLGCAVDGGSGNGGGGANVPSSRSVFSAMAKTNLCSSWSVMSDWPRSISCFARSSANIWNGGRFNKHSDLEEALCWYLTLAKDNLHHYWLTVANKPTSIVCSSFKISHFEKLSLLLKRNHLSWAPVAILIFSDCMVQRGLVNIRLTT